jgi:hypothetical protein
MVITNRNNLPQPLVEAILRDPYVGHASADITVTRLIQPPRKVYLERKYADQLQEDVTDRLWALYGQIVHGILARAGASSGIIEKRYYGTMDGWSVSGQVDIILKTQTIVDYKFTSVWQAKNGVTPEWEQQVNLLAWLARTEGHAINDGQIIALFRDWSKLEARRDPAYPQEQVKVMTVPLWETEKLLAFVKERVGVHQAASLIVDDVDLPLCTPEERWERETKWAVMKKGRKRAVKLWDNEEDAQKHAAAEKHCSVEVRRGEAVRCLAYCAAAPFCSFARGLVAKEEEPQQEEPSESQDFAVPVSGEKSEHESGLPS